MRTPDHAVSGTHGRTALAGLCPCEAARQCKLTGAAKHANRSPAAADAVQLIIDPQTINYRTLHTAAHRRLSIHNENENEHYFESKVKRGYIIHVWTSSVNRIVMHLRQLSFPDLGLILCGAVCPCLSILCL